MDEAKSAEWIAVADRLPPQGVPVVGWCPHPAGDDPRLCLAIVHRARDEPDGGWMDSDCNVYGPGDVTHWMMPPGPPGDSA